VLARPSPLRPSESDAPSTLAAPRHSPSPPRPDGAALDRRLRRWRKQPEQQRRRGRRVRAARQHLRPAACGRGGAQRLGGPAAGPGRPRAGRLGHGAGANQLLGRSAGLLRHRRRTAHRGLLQPALRADCGLPAAARRPAHRPDPAGLQLEQLAGGGLLHRERRHRCGGRARGRQRRLHPGHRRGEPRHDRRGAGAQRHRGRGPLHGRELHRRRPGGGGQPRQPRRPQRLLPAGLPRGGAARHRPRLRHIARNRLRRALLGDLERAPGRHRDPRHRPAVR